MENALRDLRLAIRRLLRSPAFTVVVVGCLAVGIGLAAAVYSIVDAVLIRSLPYEDPEELVLVNGQFLSRDLEELPASGHEFLDYRDRSTAFDEVAAIGIRSLNLTGRGEPERLVAGRASASLFPLLGVEAAEGRTFLPEEDVHGRNDVALLTHRLWSRRFGSDPSIVGEKLVLNGRPHTVVGVLPEDFWFLSKGYDLWIPIAMNLSNLPPRNARGPTVVARIRDGLSLEEAQLDMDRVALAMQREHPDFYPSDSGWGVRLTPLRQRVLGGVTASLWVLSGAAGLILLLAIVNVANLMLARASDSDKEVGLRTALGAGRLRLLRQYLTEGVVLALLAGFLGLILAEWTTTAAIAIEPGRIPRLDEVEVGGRVIVFTLFLALLAGGSFGSSPAARPFSGSLASVLKEGTRATAVGSRAGRVRAALVVAQIAVACSVLIGAGLVIQTLRHLRAADPGFRVERVLTFRVYLGPGDYPRAADRARAVAEMTDRLEAIPAVRSAAAISHLPLGLMDLVAEVKVPGRSAAEGGETIATGWRMASPGFFETLDVPLRSGRSFRSSDTADAAGVVVLDEALARRLFPDRDPVGQRIALLRFDGSEDWRRVVGVVGHVQHGGAGSESQDQLYVPYAQYPFQVVSLVMRTEVDPVSLAPEVRSAMGEVAPDLPLLDLVPMEEFRRQSLSTQRLNAFLFTIFAAVALVMAAAGVYSMMAYAVAQRTRELGVRVALGADRREILGLVMRRAARLTGIGLALGVAGAWALGYGLESQLYGVEPLDPVLSLAVAAFLAATALVASFLPAVRATRVDPVTALGTE